jgi:hypothetical protein
VIWRSGRSKEIKSVVKHLYTIRIEVFNYY